MRDRFRTLAAVMTTYVGTPAALIAAIAVIVVWAISGPVFAFSDTWQLAINTGTTIVTFLMVFVIQASQNREARATQLKLDELIRAVRGARNELIAVENAPEETVELHKEEFQSIVQAARATDPDVLDDVASLRPGDAHAATNGAAYAGATGTGRASGTTSASARRP